MKWGVLGVLGNAAFMMPFQVLMALGYSQVYWDVDDYGWGWLVASSVLYFAFTETCIYWVHRWLHTVPFLYDRYHHIHHKWKSSTSWVSMAFHPADSFAQAVPHHLAMFLFPVHGVFYMVMVSFVAFWSVVIHDRVSFVKWKLINYTDHHTVHHWVGDYNYGQFTTVWDRLMGSYRDPDVLAKDDPGLLEAMSHHTRPSREPAREQAA
jgi:lathosterol oxidase